MEKFVKILEENWFSHINDLKSLKQEDLI